LKKKNKLDGGGGRRWQLVAVGDNWLQW